MNTPYATAVYPVATRFVWKEYRMLRGLWLAVLALGMLFQSLWPALVPHPTSFVVVGMAGFFAAAAKTPFSTLVMVGEMTGNYNLLLPSLWVSVYQQAYL